MELLRLATAGSVDDGKSTLIGRLLYDAKGIFEDQLESIRRTSEQRGSSETDLALLTDGLRAEREQGITIDVAYRYFATPKRKFIIADTPGHTEYTRNMVTGASTAHVSLILIDARKGVIEQTRRHSFLSSMLGVPHMVVCVNKMDLIDWDREQYERIESDFMEFAARLNVHDIAFIPISALKGDNVVQRSEAMWWYDGSPLLNHLESIYIGSDENFIDPRFPVQYVIRSQTPDNPDFRGYAGTVASGVLRPGDEVLVLPTGTTSRIKSIVTADGEVREAFPPMAVVVTLDDDIAVSRGDVLCRPNNRPTNTHEIEATVCWMDERQSLAVGRTYLLKQSTRIVRATVESLQYRLDVNGLRRDDSASTLDLNEIGRVSFHCTEPLLVDDYGTNRTTGSFIVIDPQTNATAGAGVIRVLATTHASPNVVRHRGRLTRADRFSRAGRAGRNGAVHGLVGGGQVDGGGRGRGGVRAERAPRLPARRRQPAARHQRRPRLLRPGPQGERATGRRGGTHVRRVRLAGAHRADLPVRGGPPPDPDAARRRGVAVLRDLRGHLARGMRAARPQGPVRRGPAPASCRGSPASTRTTSRRSARSWCSHPTPGASPNRCRACSSSSSTRCASGWPRRTAVNAGWTRANRTGPGRHGARHRSGGARRWDRRRRRLAWALVAVLIVVVAGIAVPLLLSSSGTPSNHSQPTALSSRTILKLPAVSALAEQGSAAWVTDDLRNVLVRFDPATGRQDRSVHLPGRPVAMVLAQGHLWVADAVDDQVVEVDPATLLIQRSVPVPAEPTGMAVLGNDVWVTSLEAHELTPVDLKTGTAGAPVDVLAGAVRVAAGYGSLWVTGTTDLLTRVTPPAGSAGPQQKTVTVGQGPIGVTTGQGAVWVANAAGGTVSEVSASGLFVTQTFHVGGDPLSVAVSGQDVYVGDGAADTVRTVSPTPGSKALRIGTVPRVLAPVASGVWVGGSNPGRVLAVTPAS